MRSLIRAFASRLNILISMTVKLLTEHNLEFLSLRGCCTGLPESTLVKMPHCWKSIVTAKYILCTWSASSTMSWWCWTTPGGAWAATAGTVCWGNWTFSHRGAWLMAVRTVWTFWSMTVWTTRSVAVWTFGSVAVWTARSMAVRTFWSVAVRTARSVALRTFWPVALWTARSVAVWTARPVAVRTFWSVALWTTRSMTVWTSCKKNP